MQIYIGSYLYASHMKQKHSKVSFDLLQLMWKWPIKPPCNMVEKIMQC